jgi:hypothetical protein
MQYFRTKITPYQATCGKYLSPDGFLITCTHQREQNMVHKTMYSSIWATLTTQAEIQNTRRNFESGFGLFYFLPATHQQIDTT